MDQALMSKADQATVDEALGQKANQINLAQVHVTAHIDRPIREL